MSENLPANHEFSHPTHPDAEALWPVMVPLYQLLLNGCIDLEANFPRQANLCGRVADVFREQLIEAELGLLNAHPEKRVQHALKARAV